MNLLRRLDPLPDGLSEGCRRAYGELEPLKQPAIEDLASANPDPNMPPPAKADEGDVTDRRLAAIHFANRHKHQP